MTRDRVAGALCLIGAALVLLACLGHRWGTVGDFELRQAVGLLDAETCPPEDEAADAWRQRQGRRQFEPDEWRDRGRDGGCYTDDHGTTSATRIEGKQFARAGQLGFVLAILTAVLAAMAAARRMRARVRLAVTLGGAAAVAALGAFAILEPYSLRAGAWHPGVAWWLALGGLALAVGGAQLDAIERPRIPWATAGLVVAAALLALTARGLAWWILARDEASVAIGPAMIHGCDRGACAWSRFGELISDGRLAIATGRLVAIGAGVAAVLAIALAIALAARQRARLLGWLVLAATAITAVAIAAFALQVSAATLAPHVSGSLSRGVGLPIAIAGVLAAMTAVVLVRRGPVWAAPVAPEVAAPPAAPASEATAVEAALDAPVVDPTPAPAPAPAAPPPAPRDPTPAPVAIPRPTAAQTPSAPIPAAAPPCPSCRAPMLWVTKRRVWLCVSCRRGGTAA